MAVLISIHPEWCEKIVAGQKTLEVRKSKPKLVPPFKCYIYQTKRREHNGPTYSDGKVIGEFICDSIRCFDVPYPAFQSEMDKQILEQSCLTYYQLHRYAYHDALYGWHISNLVIYDKPKKLSDFYIWKKCNTCRMSGYESTACIYDEDCKVPALITRPPQSWCYVEEAHP